MTHDKIAKMTNLPHSLTAYHSLKQNNFSIAIFQPRKILLLSNHFTLKVIFLPAISDCKVK